MTTTHTNLGELISLFYEEFLALYGDEDVAAVAAAATINDLLLAPDEDTFEAVQADAA